MEAARPSKFERVLASDGRYRHSRVLPHRIVRTRMDRWIPLQEVSSPGPALQGSNSISQGPVPKGRNRTAPGPLASHSVGKPHRALGNISSARQPAAQAGQEGRCTESILGRGESYSRHCRGFDRRGIERRLPKFGTCPKTGIAGAGDLRSLKKALIKMLTNPTLNLGAIKFAWLWAVLTKSVRTA